MAAQSAIAVLMGITILSSWTTGQGLAADPQRQARAWAGSALLGEQPAEPPPGPGLELVRQDHGEFRLRQSVMNTPLKLGDTSYQHGLGTHSVSQIVVRLPRPGQSFEARAGVDNNFDTQGKRGSVVFVVQIAGKEVFRSEIRRGSDQPLPVQVELHGTTEFVLRVLDAGDGPAYDQADWADAAVVLDGGRRLWLDEMPLVSRSTGLAPGIPFSFVYGGKPSAELLPTWNKAGDRQSAEHGRQRHVVTYTDPRTKLEVASEVTLFAGHPAVDWVLQFRNAGQADTPILENILPLDLAVRVPGKGSVVLHHAQGSTCSATDFLPVDEPLPPAAAIELAPHGGRSSNGCLPFVNLQWPGGGLVGAVGWSGQWALRLRRDQGPRLTLQAGQQKTHFVLHPGEAVRTPRMLLVFWDGDDPLRGHNLLRRLLLEHYVPRINGEIWLPPLTHNTWFMFNTGNAVTEQNQLDAIRSEAPLGIEGYWLDAGWFEGGWPTGVGSWVPKADAFPHGLKPLGDAAHAHGMKFVVWFEPERVHPQSRIGRQHPRWVLRSAARDGLFNLGDPAARQWLTDYLSQCIADWGIDVYRNDFNIDPLPFWQAADAPDRQGMAEIRYVEGLYRMWDELRRRRPGLVIDNCASGGRRIDLETVSRSFPLWRSDSQCCGRPMPVQDQVQAAGLSLYVPLHAGGCWSVAPYSFSSIATTGTNFCPDLATLPAAEARRAIAELEALRPCYLGDYYPLLEISASQRCWCGWQYDRPDLGRGFAMVFRRAESEFVAADVALRGLDPQARYEVALAESYQSQPPRTMSGSDLTRLRITLDAAPESVLITYRKRTK
jgi:alpha-galactosidase